MKKSKIQKNTYIYKIKVEKLEEGGFLATCADLKGALAEGDTAEEAIENCQDAIKIILEYRKERAKNRKIILNTNKLFKKRSALFNVPVTI